MQGKFEKFHLKTASFANNYTNYLPNDVLVLPGGHRTGHCQNESWLPHNDLLFETYQAV